jgi:D-3-phosphoglycerate dehydrogenase / 2-oxoglutarate reductase
MAKRFVVVDTTTQPGYPERAMAEIAGLDIDLRIGSDRSAEDVIECCREADVMLVTAAYVTREILNALPRLKGVVRYGVGLDRIDLKAAMELGVEVCNVRDFCTNEMADHAVMLALACARNLGEEARNVRQGQWQASERRAYRLRGRCAGIIGLGDIGCAVASRLRAFGMDIIAFDPYAKPEQMASVQARAVDINALFAEADIVSVHCALTDDTRGMIGRDQFEAMKSTAILVNTARGGVVDEAALTEALKMGKIAAAGLDVIQSEPPPPSHPLLLLDNIIVTPHTGWRSEEAHEDVIVGAFKHVARILNRIATDGTLA